MQVSLSLEQLDRNTFSKKTKPLGILEREKQNKTLCFKMTRLFLNTLRNLILEEQTFLSCVLLQARLSKDHEGLLSCAGSWIKYKIGFYQATQN